MGKAVGSGSIEAEAVAEGTANHANSDRFTGCQSGRRFGGIGRYSMSLAKAMLRLETNHEFYLLLNSRLPNENFIRAEFANLMPQQNILTFDIPAYIAAENDLPAHTRLAALIPAGGAKYRQRSAYVCRHGPRLRFASSRLRGSRAEALAVNLPMGAYDNP